MGSTVWRASRPSSGSLLTALLAAHLTLGCGSGRVPAPIQNDSDAATDAAPPDSGADATPPDLGAPCVDDGQCDDGIACTIDRCDPVYLRCRHTPDDSLCFDAVYCDGLERCDRLLGCVEGEPISCSDNDTCTIDACVEETQTCVHAPRDADGDGDPDKNCGGGDCNDTNPAVSSLALEVCDNGVDDDCDGEIDEEDCAARAHDDCADALTIDAPGTYRMSTAGAERDHGSVCSDPGHVDVVAAIVTSELSDVDVLLRSSQPSALALAALCGDPSSELACDAAVPTQTGEHFARLWARSLPAGAHPLYLFSPSGQSHDLTVRFREASTAPSNETCGTAQLIAVGEPVTAQVVGVKKDVESRCSVAVGELVYRFTLPQPSDVRVFAFSLDGVGQPQLSLRREPCVGLGAELTCQTGPSPSLFARALPAGDYYVAVSATAPTEVDFVVEASLPSVPPEDESCESPPQLTLGVPQAVSMDDHTSDVELSCLTSGADAVYGLTLMAPSDLMLTQRVSAGDTGAVALLDAAQGEVCGAELACERGSSPVRLRRHALAAGDYQVVLKSARGAPVEVTALRRPAGVPSLVAFADTCEEAILIPPEGGFFQGNTANANADYAAGCDLGAQPAGGAADQMLRLVLPERRRVIFDMQGSGYQTLLNVRRGPDCPGTEVPRGCAAGYVPGRSYLDLELDAGEYFVQVDGYNRDSGPWYLDVFVAPP